MRNLAEGSKQRRNRLVGAKKPDHWHLTLHGQPPNNPELIQQHRFMRRVFQSGDIFTNLLDVLGRPGGQLLTGCRPPFISKVGPLNHADNLRDARLDEQEEFIVELSGLHGQWFEREARLTPLCFQHNITQFLMTAAWHADLVNEIAFLDKLVHSAKVESMGLFDFFSKKWQLGIRFNGSIQVADVADRKEALGVLCKFWEKGFSAEYANYLGKKISTSQFQDLYADAAILLATVRVCEKEGCDLEQIIANSNSSQSANNSMKDALLAAGNELSGKIGLDVNDTMIIILRRLSRGGILNVIKQQGP